MAVRHGGRDSGGVVCCVNSVMCEHGRRQWGHVTVTFLTLLLVGEGVVWLGRGRQLAPKGKEKLAKALLLLAHFSFSASP